MTRGMARFDTGAAEDRYRTLPEPGPCEKHAAARAVAQRATDAGDCRVLLDMLGLTPQDGLTKGDTNR